MTDDVSTYRDLLDTSAAVIRAVYMMLDEETQAIAEAALMDHHRLAIIADATGFLLVLLDETNGLPVQTLASVNAVTGKETLYGLTRASH
ncbi:hypothetical protein [Paraburkholderia pallida]|uniref:Uncharacterized protein n=1 Tax=Paraburkholderia pallida TaxID=2547399 RepID=A0A4P7CUD3_9BURK|nr:hypothetical protein [Paraburkholderia pallida]QBQ97864.1 hypothetical protein E1956_12210 [Paraburkholderia pallida]